MSVPASFTLHLPDVFPEPVLGIDAGGQIVYVNQASEDWFGTLRFQMARDVLPVAALAALEGEQPEPDACRLVNGERRVAQWTDVTPPHSGFQILLARDVTEQVTAAETLSNRMRRLEVVHGITLALARGEPVEEVCHLAIDNLNGLIRIRRGGMLCFDGRRLSAHCSWTEGAWSTNDEGEWALDDTPASSAIYRRMPVQMRTTGADAIRWKELRTLDRQGVRAVLYVPLAATSEIIGVLTLGTGDVAGFSPDDVQAATEVAAQLSTAMVRRQLDEALARSQRELQEAVAQRTRELESAQEALIQAAKLSTLGELAAGLAHELSQPIGVISGHAELLRHVGSDPARLMGGLAIIQGASERMARLVEDMRNFARPGAEVMEPFDLCDAVDMALELSCRVCPEVLVTWSPPPAPMLALGDQHRIEQVLINLLTNARYATSHHGGRSVQLEARRLGRDLPVSISDQGGGVPTAIRDRLFDPFFTTKGADGTGLGLSISARIVQEHGGTLTLEDIPGGARFVVSLRAR